MTLRSTRILVVIILPGVFSWGDHPYDEITDFIKQVGNQNIPITAICGATSIPR